MIRKEFQAAGAAQSESSDSDSRERPENLRQTNCDTQNTDYAAAGESSAVASAVSGPPLAEPCRMYVYECQ